MKLRPLAPVLVLALALAACGGEEEMPAPVEAPAAEIPSAAELAAQAAEPPPVPAPVGAAPGAPGAGMPDPNLGGLAQGLGAAMRAGEENADLPPCEQAYASITAMLAAMQKQFGAGQANGNMPTREQFVAGCGALPENMQRCMSMQYAMTHQQECEEARTTLDPETTARVQELMGRPAR